MGSVGWEDWSRFGSINVEADSEGNSRSVKLKTRDVWHFGLGAQYQYTPEWMLTAGFSYDTSMSSDASHPIMLPLGRMYRYGTGSEHK